jgi:nicotinamide-nucleotide amidase
VRWFVEHVLPARLDRGAPRIWRRTLKVVGIGESKLETMVLPVVEAFRDRVDFGYRALAGENHIKLAVRAPSNQAAAHLDEAEAAVHAASNYPAALLDEAEAAVRSVLADRIYGVDDEELAAVVGRMLAQYGWTVATAESCTGGLIGSMLTEIAGSSAYFHGGFVTYANEAKTRWLGVDAELLAVHGAVSDPVARAMAEGVRRESGATWGLSATGVAGPSGGSKEKPVGTVFVGLAGAEATHVLARALPGARASIRIATARLALDLLRRTGLQRSAG